MATRVKAKSKIGRRIAKAAKSGDLDLGLVPGAVFRGGKAISAAGRRLLTRKNAAKAQAKAISKRVGEKRSRPDEMGGSRKGVLQRRINRLKDPKEVKTIKRRLRTNIIAVERVAEFERAENRVRQAAQKSDLQNLVKKIGGRKAAKFARGQGDRLKDIMEVNVKSGFHGKHKQTKLAIKRRTAKRKPNASPRAVKSKRRK